MAADEISPHFMRKLEMIKEIKQKTSQLESLRNRLRQESSYLEGEERCLDEYRTEMELLLQEKMAHVEELRLIHADINLLETTIKQSEEERNRALEKAKKIYLEILPMKDEVDNLRCALGLEPTVDATDEGDKLPADLLDRKPHMSSKLPSADQPGPSSMPVDLTSFDCAPLAASNPFGFGHLGATVDHHHHVSHSASAAVQTAALSHHASGSKIASDSRATAGPSAPPSFRQQPPPMKACLSCHQQIHRNAPICPLCKAKSRSRNPKKPKRKADD